MDFIYERFKIPRDIKIETVTGGSAYKGKVWKEIAMQIYCENGKDDFRDIGHFASGAPFIYGEDSRISISHTDGCLAVATMKVSPDSLLSEFTPETALGIDVEKADRDKVLKLRERFLTDEELKIIPQDSVEANIIAWTCKEAMLKAGMDSSIDWRHDIVVTRLPSPGKDGEGFIHLRGEKWTFHLHTLPYEHFIITVATIQ